MFSHMINTALSFAGKGLPVFPCSPKTKQPLTTHGFNDATIDVYSIKAYWNKYPKAMIGLPTGSVSKLWAVDCDGQEGKDNFLELCSSHGYQPNTLIQNTPSGGCHYLFTLSKGVIIRNSAGKLAKNVDVRGEGGYIIIAPSCRSDGRCYT